MPGGSPLSGHGHCRCGEVQLQRFRDTHQLRELTRDGLVWRYYCCGSGGQTLLILPGGEWVAELGFPFVAEFEGECRIVYPSYPENAGLSEILGGLQAIMDAEGVRRFCVFGASFGGNVAQTLVRTIPDRVSGLILAATGAPDRSLIRPTERLGSLVRLIPEPFLKALLAKLMAGAVPASVPTASFWREFLQQTVRSGMSKAGMMSLLAATVAYRQQVFTPNDLASWDGPVTIIQSERDEVVQVRRRNALAAIYPTATVVTLKEAGHIAWLSNWDEFVSAMRSLLSRAS